MRTHTIALSGFGFEVEIAPAAGGGIARLDWHGLPILRSAVDGAVEARDPLGLSSFPMTPYASRIVDGVLSWGGVTTKIAPNMAGGAHPLHGIGWHTPWAVRTESQTEVVLELRHAGDEDWPWAFVSRQIFSLATDHFAHRLEVQSLDQRPFPSSLGPHPYFYSDNARISFTSDAIWEITGESLPSHLARSPVVDSLAVGVAAAVLDLDHCFEGWNGRARIDWVSHGITLEADIVVGDTPLPCTRLQLYTPKGAGFFCLEPVTARGVSFTDPDPFALGVIELKEQVLSIATKFSPYRL